jgi:hypothetical protein
VVGTTEVIEGLQARAESDGLFYAIYRPPVRRPWLAAQIAFTATACNAKRIVESEASVEDFALHRQRSYVSGGAYEPVKYTRLVEWLEENGVQYTPEAMRGLPAPVDGHIH